MTKTYGWTPRCTYQYRADPRCSQKAAVHLRAPSKYPNSDKPTPGVVLCLEHASEIIAEYREKLDEVWRTEPIQVLA